MDDVKPRLLLVEDDEVDQLAFIRMLESESLPYEYEVAQSVAEAKEALEEGHFDVIILDYLLGDGTAFDIMNEMVLDAPIIVVTGTGDEEVAVTAMRSGAYDYLIKDIERKYLKMLPLSVENAMRRREIESESRLLTQAMMSIHDSVFVTDMQDRIIFVNTAFCRTYGYEAAEIIGRGAGVLGELGWKGEYDHVRQDGERIPISLTRSVVKDENEKEIAIIGVARDISEIKRAEEELLAQKQLFENLVAIARVTSERPTLEATLQNTLDVAADLTGAEMGSMFLLNEEAEVVHSILARGRAQPEEKAAIVGRVMDRGLAGWVVQNRSPALIDDTQEDDRWLSSKDERHTLRSALSVPIQSHGHVIGVLTLTHSDPNRFNVDHLNLIQAAADQMALALRNAQMFDEQRRLADLQVTLYQVLRTVGSHLDPDTAANVAVEEIVRLTDWPSVAIILPDEAGEETYLRLQARAGPTDVEEDHSEWIRNGAIAEVYRSGEGTTIDLAEEQDGYQGLYPKVQSALVVPLRRGDRVVGVLLLESDRQRSFNASDRQLAESLADAITLGLENARLFEETQQTAERLRELDRLKSAFLANMSHELRTPLNAILGYSELLQDDAKELGFGEFVTDLENIQRAGRHLLAVINDILDFSKIEAGRMDLFLERFDISALIEDVITTIQPLVERNENNLEVHCPSDLGAMKADPTKVRQILINLLSNATKFTEEGEIFLDVFIDRSDGTERVTFKVSDTGIGMSEKQLENLFQPFIQGDISTTRKYGGTGLGLAITRGFCQMMGGDISVESELNVGTRFRVSLPIDVSEVVDVPEEAMA